MRLGTSIIASTQEVFSMMVMMAVEPHDPLCEPTEILHNSVTGMVGLTGLYQGLLSVHVPYPVALAIATNMLGDEIREVNEDVTDMIGELANMLGGSIKLALSPHGKDIQLSTPTTASGGQYKANKIPKARWAAVTFSTEHGEFIVDLKYRAQEEAVA